MANQFKPTGLLWSLHPCSGSHAPNLHLLLNCTTWLPSTIGHLGNLTRRAAQRCTGEEGKMFTRCRDLTSFFFASKAFISDCLHFQETASFDWDWFQPSQIRSSFFLKSFSSSTLTGHSGHNCCPFIYLAQSAIALT